MSTTCPCGQPVADQAYLCRSCTDRLGTQLQYLPELAVELEVTRTRQHRMGGRDIGTNSRASERPLPWHHEAGDIADTLHATLVSWTLIVLAERGHSPEGPACTLCTHDSCDHVRVGTEPTDNTVSLSGYLHRNLRWLRHHPDADELADEIDDVTRRTRQVIDRRPDVEYIGPCRAEYATDPEEGTPDACCLAEMYAQTGKDTIRCRECGNEHNTPSRRRWLLEVVEDQLADATTLAGAVSSLQQPISPSAVRGYAHRGRLIPHGHDETGRPFYRVGDLLDILAADRTRRSA